MLADAPCERATECSYRQADRTDRQADMTRLIRCRMNDRRPRAVCEQTHTNPGALAALLADGLCACVR